MPLLRLKSLCARGPSINFVHLITAAQAIFFCFHERDQRFGWPPDDRPVETINVAWADKDALHTEAQRGLRDSITPGAEAQI